MPSASSKSSQRTSHSSPDIVSDPFKCFLSVLERKMRNLEKRRGKLIETRKKAEQGDVLNDDQKKALENLAKVDNSLETVKELITQAMGVETEYTKQMKKEQKKVKQEQKDLVVNRVQQSIKEVVEVQCILGDLSDDVKADFLSGTNGACQLTEAELQHLDTVYELVNPNPEEESKKSFSVRVNEASKHLVNLVEGKDIPIDASPSITYKQVNAILMQVKQSGYLDKDKVNEADDAVVDNEEAVAVEQTSTPVEPSCPDEEEEQVETRGNDEAEPGPEPVNGVDLPPEVQPIHDDKINFMGESEIQQPLNEAPPLNPVSPEFIPRNMKSADENGVEGWTDAGSHGGGEQWHAVESHQGNQQSGGSNFRGHNNGRGGRGFGNRGGRGRGGGGNFRGRQDGYRGGNRGGRGDRGDGNYRGSNRGSRGGQRGGRGGPRGGGSRDNFGKSQQQQ